MYSFIYILVAFVVALSAGIWTYRNNHSTDSFDYAPAIAAGFLWPIAITLGIIFKGLDLFKDLCIKISNSIDEAAEQRLKKEAAKSKEP